MERIVIPMLLAACAAALAAPAWADEWDSTRTCLFEHEGAIHAITSSTDGKLYNHTGQHAHAMSNVTDWRIMPGPDGWEAERAGSAVGEVWYEITGTWNVASVIGGASAGFVDCPAGTYWLPRTNAIVPSGSDRVLRITAAHDAPLRVEEGWSDAGAVDPDGSACAFERDGEYYAVTHREGQGETGLWRITHHGIPDPAGWTVEVEPPTPDLVFGCVFFGNTVMLSDHPYMDSISVTAMLDAPPMIEVLGVGERSEELPADVCLEEAGDTILATMQYPYSSSPHGWSLAQDGPAAERTERLASCPPGAQGTGRAVIASDALGRLVKVIPSWGGAPAVTVGPRTTDDPSDPVDAGREIIQGVSYGRPGDVWAGMHIVEEDVAEYRPVDYSASVGIVWDGLPYAVTFGPGDLNSLNVFDFDVQERIHALAFWPQDRNLLCDIYSEHYDQDTCTDLRNRATSVGGTAWNITDGMSPVRPNPYGADDAEWGQMGYAHLYLDGEKYGVVATVGGPPALTPVRDVEAYVAESEHEVKSAIDTSGGPGVLSVTQMNLGVGWLNYTLVNHNFYSVDEPAVAAPDGGTSIPMRNPTKMVVNIDGQNYAVINTIEGPPVLADPMEAAALGVGDITSVQPADYLRLDVPLRMQAIQVDTTAHVQILKSPQYDTVYISQGSGDPSGVRLFTGVHTYAAVWAGGLLRIYDITDPLRPHEIAYDRTTGLDAPWRWGSAPRDIGFAAPGYGNETLSIPQYVTDIPYPRLIPGGSILKAVQKLPEDLPAQGTGVAYANLVHPERADHTIPGRFNFGAVEPWVGAEGPWAVIYTGNGIALAEVNPNAAIAVIRDGGQTYVVERDSGWHSSANHVSAYDVSDPAEPVKTDPATWPPSAAAEYGRLFEPQARGWGDEGRAAVAGFDGIEWALIPVRQEYAGGPIMEVSGLSAGLSTHYANYNAGVDVRNIHHEPITVNIDRVELGLGGALILEAAHRYSDFESPETGAVRIIQAPGRNIYSDPTPAYPATEVKNRLETIFGSTSTAHVIYSSSYNPSSYDNRVFAYVTGGNPIHLAPGEAKRISVGIYSPCLDDTPYELPGACGIGGARLDLGSLSLTDWSGPDRNTIKFAEITVVANGYPERSVTVSRP